MTRSKNIGPERRGSPGHAPLFAVLKKHGLRRPGLVVGGVDGAFKDSGNVIIFDGMPSWQRS